MMAIPEYRRQLHYAASPIGLIEIMTIRIAFRPAASAKLGVACERAGARSSANWRRDDISLHTMPVGADT